MKLENIRQDNLKRELGNITRGVVYQLGLLDSLWEFRRGRMKNLLFDYVCDKNYNSFFTYWANH